MLYGRVRINPKPLSSSMTQWLTIPANTEQNVLFDVKFRLTMTHRAEQSSKRSVFNTKTGSVHGVSVSMVNGTNSKGKGLSNKQVKYRKIRQSYQRMLDWGQNTRNQTASYTWLLNWKKNARNAYYKDADHRTKTHCSQCVFGVYIGVYIRRRMRHNETRV